MGGRTERALEAKDNRNAEIIRYEKVRGRAAVKGLQGKT